MIAALRPVDRRRAALLTLRMSAPFAPFGTAHLASIALTFVVPSAAAAIVRADDNPRIGTWLRYAFAAELITTYILWYWLIVVRGWASVENMLPMNLCDWAVIAAIITLIHPNQKSYELAYFWALSGTLQALVTPTLFYDFPDLRFIVFFAFHGGAIASVLYLTFGLGMRPYPQSIPRVIAWSLLYFVSALVLNWLLHTNFGYLSAKPAKASLLDLMSPWPYYVVELVGLGILYVLVLYLPFYLADSWRRRRAGFAGKKNGLHFR